MQNNKSKFSQDLFITFQWGDKRVDRRQQKSPASLSYPITHCIVDLLK